MAITISGENNNDRILAQDGVIDEISGINIVGLLTAGHINVGSNIQLGNAGVVTATTFIGNLTGNVNATSNLLLQIGGSEKFRVASSGQLGIGGANYGSSGQVLTSGGSGSAASWTTIPAQATIANNADNRVITGGSGVNLNGESGLTFDGNNFEVTATSGTIKINSTGPGIHFIDTNADSDFMAQVDGSIFKLVDLTNSDSIRLQVASNGTVTVNNTLNVNTRLNVGANSVGFTPHTTSWATGAALNLKGNYGGGITFNDNDNNGFSVYVDSSGVNFHIKNGAVGGSLKSSVKCIKDGTVELYHNNTKKFETQSYGASAIGQIYVTHSGTTPGFSLSDNGRSGWGSSNDLVIYHNTTDSYVSNSTGHLRIGNTHDSSNIKFFTNNSTRWNIDSNGHFVPDSNNTFNIGSSSYTIGDLYLSGNITSSGNFTSSSAAPLIFTNNGNTTSAKKTVVYTNYNNTSNHVYNGLLVEMGHVTDSLGGEVRKFTIGERGGHTNVIFDQNGIHFGHGSTNPSLSASTGLDDYEEGTFSPYYTDGQNTQFSQHGSGYAYGEYVKIGRLIYFTCGVRCSGYSRTPSGRVFLHNLPFVSYNYGDDDEPQFSMQSRLWGSGNQPKLARMQQGTGGVGRNRIALGMDPHLATNESYLQGSDCDTSATCRVVISGHYMVP